MPRRTPLFILVALACAAALPAAAQDRVLSFALTGGAQVAPAYFGADDHEIGPTGAFGFGGLRAGSIRLGDVDGPRVLAPGAGLRGAFRYIPEREGTGALAGLDNVDAALELGAGLHYTAPRWQVFADLRYGAIGHEGVAGEVGANLIHRGADGLVLHAGPRAEFGNARFARSYFGVTGPEAAASGLAAYTPSGGVHAVGVELGVYRPLGDRWGLTGTLRYDRLRGDAAASPIVRQGSRDQVSATLGLTRHFTLRF